MADITMRLAGEADAPALHRLAVLDSATLPNGHVLVIEVDGDILAAVEVTTGRTVADPFRRTSELVSLLEVRAAQLKAEIPLRAGGLARHATARAA